MQEKPKISIVIPVYNEAGNLNTLYGRLTAVLNQQHKDYELVFVDDGSTDDSLKILEQLNQKDHKVKIISFSRNFGHMIALSAGLDHAQGDAVITMDADLQHPPETIPQLIKEWEKGAEVVTTIRKHTKGVGAAKNITAGFFYWLINKIGKIKLPANSADFRLLDHQVVESLKQIKERSRFLRGLISWVGFKQVFVEYDAEERTTGQTKYTFSRMFSFAIDGITSFSTFPLRLASYLGLFTAFISFLYILYAIYIRVFTNQAIAGWTSVLVAVLFIGGIQLIFLGIIGEYLGRVFEETKQRPLYIIKKQIGF